MIPGFLSWKMAQVEDVPSQTVGEQGQRRVVFVETYELADRAALQTYFDEYAQPVRDDHTRMWDGKFAARRRILHVFGTQTEQVGGIGGPSVGEDGTYGFAAVKTRRLVV